jgi:hypothetical protein
MAYPVVKDQNLVLRGFNYWDVTEARVVFTPVVLGAADAQQRDLQSRSFSSGCQ